MGSTPGTIRHDSKGPTDTHLRCICIALLVATLGLALGACSKCDVPVWMPGSCHAGPGAGNFQ